MSKRYIVASFDDGHKLDSRLADLLLKYNIPSVFYIPVGNCGLTESQIKTLSEKELFEIGSHGINHVHLKEMVGQGKEKEVMQDIAGSKASLEAIIKRPVARFSYPFGQYNEQVKEMVKTAGYKSARTTKLMSTDFPKDPYAIAISICIYPEVTAYKGKSWIEVGYELFDKVIKEGGRFELYGHSADLEEFNMWEFLEDFLAYMDQEMTKINYKRKP